MNNKIVVFADLDDTSLQPNHKFSERLKRVVDKMHEIGHYFIPTTARSMFDAKSKACELGIDKFGGIVASNNGASVYDFNTDKLIVNKVIPQKQVLLIFDYINSKIDNFKINLVGLNEIYTNKHDDSSKYWADVMGIKYFIVDYFAGIKTSIVNIIIFVNDLQNLDLLVSLSTELENRFPNLSVEKYSARSIEIAIKNTNKGSSIKEILDYLGYTNLTTTLTTYGFGDGLNDLPMVGVVDKFVAVDNAVNELKQIANDVTLTSTQDGVADYIEKYILEKG